MGDSIGGSGAVAGRSASRPVVLDRTARRLSAGRNEGTFGRSAELRDRYLAKLREVPEIRQDLVSRIRREIQRGDYDTTERIEGALDAMGDEVDLLA